MSSSSNSSFQDLSSDCRSNSREGLKKVKVAVEMEPRKRNLDQELTEMDEHLKLAAPWNFKIWDINQQIFTLLNNRLLAAPQNSSRPGDVMDVVPNPVLDSKKQPVFMAIKNRSQILSCKKPADGLPELQLVGGDIMDLYKKHQESLEFTFYAQTKGSAKICCFESAAFPGWFLSTSPEPNKPLGLSQPGGSEITLFYFERTWDY